MINQTFFVQLQFSVVHDVVVRTFANATPNLEFWRENCSNTNDENSDSLHFFQKNPGNGFPNTYSTDTKKICQIVAVYEKQEFLRFQEFLRNSKKSCQIATVCICKELAKLEIFSVK